ncbi:MAG: hypothetical protein IJ368_04565 [Oscillospiraceae bacterium]|nr:hypothetical protein [Oscillospiraceae bacterium]
MNYRYAAFLFLPLALCGCSSEKISPMEELPPEQFPSQTSSTYTGTTVDYIYITTTSQPLPPSYGITMPEFPAITGFETVDDPFDEDFYALFDEVYPTETVTVPSMSYDTEGYNTIQVSDVFDHMTEAAMPSEEFTMTETLPISENITLYDETYNAQTVTLPSMPDIDEFNMETIDIERYMPKEEDFPPFPYDELYEYLN